MASGSSRIKQGFADVPEGQIHYRTAGEGPNLLLLHLTTASSDIYTDVMPILATRYRVIAMDRFGHGGSDPLPEVVTIEVLTRCVINFLDAMGVERTSIVGQSTGCHEAVELAITEPQRVEKLVLARITDWDPEERAMNARADELSVRYGRERKMDGSHLLEEWITRRDFAISPATTPEIMHRMGMSSIESERSRRDISWAVARNNIRERLPLLRVPTLFISFEYAPQPHDVLHKSLVPSSVTTDLVTIKGGGRMALMEQPEQFAKAIMDFLAKH